MNKVILTGRFTRDPEIKYTNDGASIARFSIAVNRRFVKEGSDQKADFLNCIAFGKSAEFIEKYFSKGMKADLSGRIQTGSYTNKDGVKVYTTDIVVEEIEFGESEVQRICRLFSVTPVREGWVAQAAFFNQFPTYDAYPRIYRYL